MVRHIGITNHRLRGCARLDSGLYEDAAVSPIFLSGGGAGPGAGGAP